MADHVEPSSTTAEDNDESAYIATKSPVASPLDGEQPLTPSTPEFEPPAHDTGALPVVIVEPHADGGSGGGPVVSEWTQCINEHGETYFCNVYTGETSWQLPDTSAEAPSDEVDQIYSHGATTNGDDTGEAGTHTVVSHRQRKSFQLVKRVMEGSIRRLDRSVQMQLEEARRRHNELEELRDEQVRLGGEHWVEMYDPTHDAFYYYGKFSGDMRWDRPESYVMKTESDAILRVVVKLQCAFRMTLARKRIFQMKLLGAERQRQAQVLLDQQEGLLLKTDPSEVSLDNDTPLQPGQQQSSLEPMIDPTQAENVWIEVYDPFHKVVYYYCSATSETRWDPPTFFISANEDKEMAAAIAIQSLSRSFLARRNVKQRKHTIRKKRQEQAVDEVRRLRELRHRDFLSKSEDERSAIGRREMIEEEMEQIRGGDRFWGIDAHDREVRRQQTEERLMASAEVFWQRVNLTMKMRGELNQHKSKEQELQRKEHEHMTEANARDAMSAQEAQQRHLNDNFWGVQGEELRESRARKDMVDEELLSRCFGQELHVRDLHMAWRQDAENKNIRDAHDKIVYEKQYQKKYMRWFYRDCTSVDELLDYLWPTMQRFAPKPKHSEHSEPLELRSSSNRYILDDLVVKQRLESGDLRYGNKSIFTIHHLNSAQILGRKGGFSIEKVESTKRVFEKSAAVIRKPKSTSPSRPMPPKVEMTLDEEEHLRMGTSVHYKRSKTPDPNVPARFNGVPFKPSQLSPTREILCSSHTKLNQLPSLSVANNMSSPATRFLSKPSKASSRVGGDKKSSSPHTTNANNNNSSCPRTNSFMQRHMSLFVSNANHTIDPMTTAFGFVGPYAVKDTLRQQNRLEYDQEGGGGSEQEERDYFDGDNGERGINESSGEDDGNEGGESDEKGGKEALKRQQKMRLDAIAERFALEEHDVLRHVFSMMDYDGSGAVNKQEMTWALQRDEEVSAMASKSMLLRALLKEHTQLDELFRQPIVTSAVVDTRDHNKNRRNQNEELSWEVFIAFCERKYVSLMDQGSLRPLVPRERAGPTGEPDQQPGRQPSHTQGDENENADPNVYREDEEEQKVRDLFAFLDYDANGVLEVEELQHALYDTSNDEISQLVRSSKALQPLLQQEMFMDAFRKFETEDPRGISQEEFVGFCLEIASIAMLNGML